MKLKRRANWFVTAS